MKHSVTIFVILIGALCASCERTIDFVDTSENLKNSLTINAVAIEGEPLGVFLNRTYSIKDVPIIPGTYGYEQIHNYTIDWQSWRKNEFYKYTAIFDARVEATVNGKDTYLLTLAADSMGYWTDYKPNVGDCIELKATFGSEMVYAEATIPAKPKIEVLEYEKIETNVSTRPLMRITCRLTDAGGNQYYRLRVRGEREGKDIIGTLEKKGDIYEIADIIDTYIYYTFNPWFESDDPLFSLEKKRVSREDLLSSYWINPSSYAFSNDLFRGKDYNFTIDVRAPYYQENFYSPDTKLISDRDKAEDAYRINLRVLLELQSISLDYYKYLKSVEAYHLSPSDSENSASIYYNAQNGFGIFGALSYDRHFVEFGE